MAQYNQYTPNNYIIDNFHQLSPSKQYQQELQHQQNINQAAYTRKISMNIQDRRRSIYKKQIYKQMLDKQIQQRQKYKKQRELISKKEIQKKQLYQSNNQNITQANNKYHSQHNMKPQRQINPREILILPVSELQKVRKNIANNLNSIQLQQSELYSPSMKRYSYSKQKQLTNRYDERYHNEEDYDEKDQLIQNYLNECDQIIRNDKSYNAFNRDSKRKYFNRQESSRLPQLNHLKFKDAKYKKKNRYKQLLFTEVYHNSNDIPSQQYHTGQKNYRYKPVVQQYRFNQLKKRNAIKSNYKYKQILADYSKTKEPRRQKSIPQKFIEQIYNEKDVNDKLQKDYKKQLTATKQRDYWKQMMSSENSQNDKRKKEIGSFRRIDNDSDNKIKINIKIETEEESDKDSENTVSRLNLNNRKDGENNDKIKIKINQKNIDNSSDKTNKNQKVKNIDKNKQDQKTKEKNNKLKKRYDPQNYKNISKQKIIESQERLIQIISNSKQFKQSQKSTENNNHNNAQSLKSIQRKKKKLVVRPIDLQILQNLKITKSKGLQLNNRITSFKNPNIIKQI